LNPPPPFAGIGFEVSPLSGAAAGGVVDAGAALSFT
jgi:hypothetical protein